MADVSERKQAGTQQRILLNELNHRVKNNMQMLQILLEAGTRRAKSSEAREVLEEASGRIMAMAAAQRILYTTHDATRFNARDFLNTVCESARQTFPQELEIDCEADPMQLSNDAAMPLALIANELLTNAVKYGLNGRAVGTLLPRSQARLSTVRSSIRERPNMPDDPRDSVRLQKEAVVRGRIGSIRLSRGQDNFDSGIA